MFKKYGEPSAAARTFLNVIENNMGEWMKGWTASELRAMKPFNPISNTHYRGKNSINLYLPEWEQSKLDPEYKIDLRYSTMRQLNLKTGSVLEGSRSHVIKFFAPAYKDGKGNFLKAKSFEEALRLDPHPVSAACIRYYRVYSYRDIVWSNPENGLMYDSYRVRDYGEQSLSSNECAEKLLSNLNVRIAICSTIQPSYVPHENTIYLPYNSEFISESRKWEAVFHELVHWTKYNFPSCSRSFPYPQEEMTAEFGSLMLCQELGIAFEPGQEAGIYDYIRSWLKSYPEELKLEIVDEALDAADKAFHKLIKFI